MILNQIKIPRTQFRNNSELLTYEETVYLSKKGKFGVKKVKGAEKARQKAKEKVVRTYEFGRNTKKRFKRAINNLSLLCVKRLKSVPWRHCMTYHEATLLTLTIPDPNPVDGAWAQKNLLVPFLSFLTKTVITTRGKGVDHYVYKVEKQERGQLHYHFVTNDMLHVQQVRRVWNQLLSKHSLLNGHLNPNSVDVRPFSAKRLSLYLSKELSKKEQNPVGLTCTTWSCSRGLNEPYFTVDLSESHRGKLSRLMKEGKVRYKTGERWTFHWLSEELNASLELLSSAELAAFEERIRIIGGTVERPAPMPVMERIEARHWFDDMMAERDVVSGDVSPPFKQLSFWLT